VPIPVAEPTVTETIEILEGLRDRYEAHHRVSITNSALAAAAELADQRLPGRQLPGKAVDLMDEAASLVRMRREAPPADLREYDEKIAQVRREKEAAIDDQDFEKGAALRDMEKKLLAKKAARGKERAAGDLDLVTEVDESLVAETLSIMLGLTSAESGGGQEAAAPPFAPATMTDDDRAVWEMA
jgi:ATP-dependent Clp protease ATP-binding subunit ClpC